MTVFIEGATVTVAELAKAMKMPEAKAVAECQGLNVYVGCDWAGRPAVSVDDAHQVVSGRAVANAEHDAKWRAYLAESEAWERQRSEIFHRVHRKVAEAALRQGRGGGFVNSAASSEAMAAARDFERRHPAPDWNGERQTVSWLVDDDNRVAVA
jgi:hypothetical protein